MNRSRSFENGSHTCRVHLVTDIHSLLTIGKIYLNYNSDSNMKRFVIINNGCQRTRFEVRSVTGHRVQSKIGQKKGRRRLSLISTLLSLSRQLLPPNRLHLTVVTTKMYLIRYSSRISVYNIQLEYGMKRLSLMFVCSFS